VIDLNSGSSLTDANAASFAILDYLAKSCGDGSRERLLKQDPGIVWAHKGGQIQLQACPRQAQAQKN
jgi:hypothetical protein